MSLLFLIFFEDDGEIRKSSVKRINYINVKYLVSVSKLCLRRIFVGFKSHYL